MFLFSACFCLHVRGSFFFIIVFRCKSLLIRSLIFHQIYLKSGALHGNSLPGRALEVKSVLRSRLNFILKL